MKKITRLLQQAIYIVSIILTFYLIACYIDVIRNNTSKEQAEQLQQHNYNIIVKGVEVCD